MFAKINFTHKNPSQNSKNYLIVKEQLVKQQIKEKENKSFIKYISLQKKFVSKKILTTSDKFEQSKENNINHDNKNTILKMKLNHSFTINNEIIDNEIIDNEIIDNEIINNEIIDNEIINNLGENIHHDSVDNFSKISIIEKDTDIYIENEMNTPDNTHFPFNVGRLHKKGIRIINNVYQSKYEYGKVNSSGLGDFLRGCYFILEVCEKYNFQPKIIFNNCISNFLLIKTPNLYLIDNILKRISLCKNNNCREFVIKNGIIHQPLKDTKNIMADFVEYTVKSPQYNTNVLIYCNSFPTNKIPEKNKEYMRKILEPTNEMKIIITQTLDGLNIYSNQYIVIHIRCGDSYLKEGKTTFTDEYIYDLINNIKNDVDEDNNYLLISDSIDVKKIIQKYFPNFKTLMHPITHFGEGVVLEEKLVENSMIDFYLLSLSKSIFSYSTYKHGSGFSYWCAKTFNIPYVCKYIQ
jgi:hypothetical protein